MHEIENQIPPRKESPIDTSQARTRYHTQFSFAASVGRLFGHTWFWAIAGRFDILKRLRVWLQLSVFPLVTDNFRNLETETHNNKQDSQKPSLNLQTDSLVLCSHSCLRFVVFRLLPTGNRKPLPCEVRPSRSRFQLPVVEVQSPSHQLDPPFGFSSLSVLQVESCLYHGLLRASQPPH